MILIANCSRDPYQDICFKCGLNVLDRHGGGITVYSEADVLLIEVQRRVIKVGFFNMAFNIYKENDFKGYVLERNKL